MTNLTYYVEDLATELCCFNWNDTVRKRNPSLEQAQSKETM
jgi:hypothetical protein